MTLLQQRNPWQIRLPWIQFYKAASVLCHRGPFWNHAWCQYEIRIPISLKSGFGVAHALAIAKLQITNHNYTSMTFWLMPLLVNRREVEDTVKFNFLPVVQSSIRICFLWRSVCKPHLLIMEANLRILIKVSKSERNQGLYFNQRPVLKSAVSLMPQRNVLIAGLLTKLGILAQ